MLAMRGHRTSELLRSVTIRLSPSAGTGVVVACVRRWQAANASLLFEFQLGEALHSSIGMTQADGITINRMAEGKVRGIVKTWHRNDVLLSAIASL